MPTKDDDILIQLATRIPKVLHRAIKLHCVETNISVMDFVANALEDKLKRIKPRTSKTRNR
jgi:predicted HicB family RNase H-like nuclease